nr:MAG: RNA-dependent RNA polymerase [Astroviridae sp.]
MFEKFHYAEACSIEEDYKDLWDFATSVVLEEYSYMDGSMIISPIQTDKNMRSTPAFPKFLQYNTEEEYILENGWEEYMELWNMDERKTPLWWTFLKNETLKKKKIQDGDIRMIMCTDPTFTRFGAAFDQHQNQLMKELTEVKQAQVGWTPFYGGFDHRLRRLETRGDLFVELDWTRFDGTIPVEVFTHIKDIRWFFHGERYKTRENRQRYLWYVHNLINKVTLLPTGEVTVIKKGNPSGQISTTTDNNMVNTFLTAFEVAYQYKQQNGNLPTVREYFLNVDSICYGDDRLLAINTTWCKYDASIIPEFYKKIFGMWVKPENIKTSESCEGLSFCGLTAVKVNDKYVGVPNVNKILSTIESPVRRLPDVEALWGKLQSLRILCEYAGDEPKLYLEEQIHRLREYCQAEKIELPEVPRWFYSKIWTGGPKNSDGESQASEAPKAKAETENITKIKQSREETGEKDCKEGSTKATNTNASKAWCCDN